MKPLPKPWRETREGWAVPCGRWFEDPLGASHHTVYCDKCRTGPAPSPFDPLEEP